MSLHLILSCTVLPRLERTLFFVFCQVKINEIVLKLVFILFGVRIKNQLGQKQWGSEYHTRLVIEWLIAWLLN